VGPRVNDADIRDRLHAEFDKDGIPWVDEINVKDCRVDMVAMIDDVLTGIEIKSDKDTLKRLVKQYALYDHRFRQVLVVTEPRHVEGVRATVGDRCGIWVCEEQENGFFLRTRSRKFGTRKPRPRAKAHSARIVYGLRRLELLQALGLDETSAMPKSEAAERVTRELSTEAIERVAIEAWQRRKTTGE